MKKILLLAAAAAATWILLRLFSHPENPTESPPPEAPAAATFREPEEPFQLGGFFPGMTAQEAMTLIQGTHAGIFPPPVIAFDECRDADVLQGVMRNPGRYRNPFLAGNKPWKDFPVQPDNIDILEPVDLATAEKFEPREGVRRYLLHFSQCFLAGNRLATDVYQPVYSPDGERLVNDNEGAMFFVDENSVVTGIYVHAGLAAALLDLEHPTPALTAETLARLNGSQPFAAKPVTDPFGEISHGWSHLDGPAGRRALVLEDGSIQLFR